MVKLMTIRTVIKIISLLITGCITDSFSQSIYLNFDPGSDEMCYVHSTPNEKESYLKFYKTVKSGNLFFRICSEEFIYTEENYCETKNRSDVEISSLVDLYVFEAQIRTKQIMNDSMVHILFKSEIDSVFIAEKIDNEKVKIYAVEWTEKVE